MVAGARWMVAACEQRRRNSGSLPDRFLVPAPDRARGVGYGGGRVVAGTRWMATAAVGRVAEPTLKKDGLEERECEKINERK